ncbi:hypothetical protein [Mycobacterium sp. URHB0021]
MTTPPDPPPGTTVPPLRRVGVRETRRATSIAFFAWTIAVYDFILFGTLLPRISESFGWSTSHAPRSWCSVSGPWSIGSAGARE